MNNNEAKLSYKQLELIASQLQSAADQMSDILADIAKEFDKIGDESTWSGTSAETSKGNFDKLSKKFPEFVDAVESCYTYLTTKVMPNYKAVENAITGKSEEVVE